MQSFQASASQPLQRGTEQAETKAASGWDTSPSFKKGVRDGCESPVRKSAKAKCFNVRSERMCEKSALSTEKLADHERRRLRAKIAGVLIEVRKRQDLHQVQEKAKKFRENRHARGVGPHPSLGDTTEFALGLTCLSEASNAQAMTSPRRTALLDSLTLEELVQLRQCPEFFFTGNAISGAVRPEKLEQAGQTMMSDRTRSFGGLGGASFGSLSSASGSDAGKAMTNLWKGSVDPSTFEDLIEFFSVASTDKDLEKSVYARNLRHQLLAIAGRRSGGLKAATDWRKILCRSEEELAPEVQPIMDENAPKRPLEMMPSLGRHPPIRYDQESPTLLKVREVYEKRDEQDAQWVDARREGISRRLALNAFKAREQQRELLLQDFKQKELHKVRMLQAEEKKAMLEAEEQERTEVMGIQKIHRLIAANERSEQLKEDKRDNCQIALEAWQAGVQRANHNVQRMEWEKRKEGAKSQEKYMERLIMLGERRAEKKYSEHQKNDELKIKIQCSLVRQVKDAEAEERSETWAISNAKQHNAAIRRQCSQLGSRYGFVEKAFGGKAVGFDGKSHSVAVDRRAKSWQKSAQDWHKIKKSFSMPSLPPARPQSPGGTLDESGFKALLDSNSGFKTETSAVALA